MTTAKYTDEQHAAKLAEMCRQDPMKTMKETREINPGAFICPLNIIGQCETDQNCPIRENDCLEAKPSEWLDYLKQHQPLCRENKS
jgi:hypothetical protein